jgi:hypothetical protein
MKQPQISEQIPPRIKKKRQRQEDFKEVLDTTLRNFFDNNCPDLSNQEKIRHLLNWGREYAEEVGLSEDLIGRSMKGYVTPIPEFTQAVQEQIQQNMDRLL